MRILKTLLQRSREEGRLIAIDTGGDSEYWGVVTDYDDTHVQVGLYWKDQDVPLRDTIIKISKIERCNFLDIDRAQTFARFGAIMRSLKLVSNDGEKS